MARYKSSSSSLRYSPFEIVSQKFNHGYYYYTAPPILPADRHCARYKFLYCIALFHNTVPLLLLLRYTCRRMFPTLRVSFSGKLEPHQRYDVYLDISPVDNKRYRYAYHRSSWIVAGKADPAPASRLYRHPDSPFSGDHLARKAVVSFEKLKLTNNSVNKNGHVRIALFVRPTRWKQPINVSVSVQHCNWVMWCWFARKWNTAADQSATDRKHLAIERFLYRLLFINLLCYYIPGKEHVKANRQGYRTVPRRWIANRPCWKRCVVSRWSPETPVNFSQSPVPCWKALQSSLEF